MSKPEDDAEELYDLELHENFVISSQLHAMRVPGGWIYYDWDSETGKSYNPVFVPYHAEFDKAEERKTYGQS